MSTFSLLNIYLILLEINSIFISWYLKNHQKCTVPWNVYHWLKVTKLHKGLLSVLFFFLSSCALCHCFVMLILSIESMLVNTVTWFFITSFCQHWRKRNPFQSDSFCILSASWVQHPAMNDPSQQPDCAFLEGTIVINT